MEWFLALWPYAVRKDDPDYGPDSIDPSTLLYVGELIAAVTDKVLAPLFARIQQFALGFPLQSDEVSAAQERFLARIDRRGKAFLIGAIGPFVPPTLTETKLDAPPFSPVVI